MTKRGNADLRSVAIESTKENGAFSNNGKTLFTMPKDAIKTMVFLCLARDPIKAQLDVDGHNDLFSPEDNEKMITMLWDLYDEINKHVPSFETILRDAQASVIQRKIVYIRNKAKMYADSMLPDGEDWMPGFYAVELLGGFFTEAGTRHIERYSFFENFKYRTFHDIMDDVEDAKLQENLHRMVDVAGKVIDYVNRINLSMGALQGGKQSQKAKKAKRKKGKR